MVLMALYQENTIIRAPKITDDIEKEIVRIASTNPRKLGLKFSTWSLRVLVGYSYGKEDSRKYKPY